MKLKTKEFQLNEETTFKNEIIHFFNINTNKSTINIYLEIDGKRMKSEKPENSFHKIILKELGLKKAKKEINCLIFEDAEIKILIRIIRKYNKYFRKRSNTFYKKADDIKRQKAMQNNIPDIKIKKKEVTIKNNSPEIKTAKADMSIKEKIKLFSGELIKKKIENKIIPGRLIIPKIFQENDDKNNKKENENKFENINKSDKKDKAKEKEENNS